MQKSGLRVGMQYVEQRVEVGVNIQYVEKRVEGAFISMFYVITITSKNMFSFWSNYNYNLFSKIFLKYSDLTEFVCMKIR